MDILVYPNPALKSGVSDVDPTTDEALRPLAEKMARMMYEAPGIGLAAPQIGVLKRFIVYDLSDDGSGLSAICNPVIVERGDETETDDEGCLSFPGISVPVERSLSVTCEGISLEGKPVRLVAEGLEARMFQHEIDHLDGILIIDRATPEERKAALRRYREAQEQGATPGQTGL